MSAVYHPVVLWAQRKDRVFVSIQVDDIKKEEIIFDKEKLTFSCKCGEKTYKAELAFFEEVVPEESKQRKGGREFFFDLKKKDTDADWWPRLLKEKTKNQFIKIDFSRWKDEDEVDEEAPGGDPMMGGGNQGLEDMMAKMGGDGFDPGEMPESDDSDDDEIPDLLEEEKK